MNDLNKKLGFDVNEMKNAAQNGQLDEFVNKNLSQKATKQLKDVLSNKEACLLFGEVCVRKIAQYTAGKRTYEKT